MNKLRHLHPAAVLTLGIAIAANTIVFSALNTLLLRSLPYHQPERLALVWGYDAEDNDARSQVSYLDTVDWRAQNQVFEDLSAFGAWTPALTGFGEAERIHGTLAGEGYFNVMRGRPIMGRLFTDAENIDGQDLVVILSHGFWQRRFGGDPDIVGSKLTLGGRPHTVVGVLAPDVHPLPEDLTGGVSQIYRPLGEPRDPKMRSARHLRAIARLKPGVTIEQAQAEMAAIAQRLERAYPSENTGAGVRVVSLREDQVSRLRPIVWMFFGAVGCLLLIACANIANLLLAQATTQQREMAVRAALGAGRGRLIGQLLWENLALAGAGGALGVLLALWGTEAVSAAAAQGLPALKGMSLDLRVLAFSFVVTAVAGVLFGLAPAVHGSRSDLIEVLKDSGRSATSGHGQRLRSALVVAEVALALVLLSGAGLLVNSIARLRRVDPGFLAENTWTTEVRLPFGRYADKQRQIDFYRGALEKLAALPGVTDAGITSVLPVSGNFDRTGVIVESHPVRAGSEPDADRYAVSPGYFAAMRIPLRRGRYLTAQDREGAAPVVVVSETMARQMWPGEDALGRRLRLSWEPHEPQRKIGARTVVGIVGDVRHYGLDRPATPQLYLPHAQYPLGGMSVVVRGTTSASAIRETLGALDRDIPRETVERIEDVIAGSMILRRYSLYLLGGFAGVAALLAAVGVYGVMSYTVSQRTPEIGVRMALGAASRDVLAMVLGRSAALIGAGMALGLALAAVLTRYLGALLFEVHPMDAPTLLAAVAALAIAALLAAIVPAQRAARVEPMVALRHE